VNCALATLIDQFLKERTLWFAKNLSRRQQQLGTLESIIDEHSRDAQELDF
jgi:hypothetical protein